MSVTTTQRTQLVQLAVGMFHLAPSSPVLGMLERFVDAGWGMNEITRIIAELPAYQTSDFYSSSLSNSEFSMLFVENLIGAYASQTDCAALATLITSYIDNTSTTSPAQARGDAQWLVIQALAGMPESDPTWGRAAARFANQVIVAEYYSVGKQGLASELNVMRSVIAPVTDTLSSVTLMFDAIDSALENSTTGAISPPDPNINKGVTLYGSDGADTLVGTAGNDLIIAGEGSDKITGDSGSDTIDAGAGDDSISGAQTGDMILGGSGTDTLLLSDGTSYREPADLRLREIEKIEVSGDTAIALILTGQTENFSVKVGGTASHVIILGSGNDIVDGGSGDEIIDGGSGNDTLKGGGGNDTFYASSGLDTVDGGAGDDTIAGFDSTDTLVGGAGSDTLLFNAYSIIGDSFSQPVDGKIATIERIDISGTSALNVDLTGQTESFNVYLTGNAMHRFIGGSGSDHFIGGNILHFLDGGAGTDTLELAADTVLNASYAPSSDSAVKRIENISVAGDTSITVDLSNQSEAFTVLLEGSGGHTLVTGSGADTVTGSDGNDFITSGPGADTIAGSAGSDSIDLRESSVARDIISYGTTAQFGDAITGFSPGSSATGDQIKLAKELLNGIGNSTKTAVTAVIANSESQVFSLDTTVVIITDRHITNGNDLSAVAELLDDYGNNATYALADRLVFAVGDLNGNTYLYHFVSDAADDIVTDAELGLIATLTGTITANLSTANFTQ